MSFLTTDLNSFSVAGIDRSSLSILGAPAQADINFLHCALLFKQFYVDHFKKFQPLL